MTTTEGLSRGIDLVSHEVRADILLALAERARETPRDGTLGFTELRKRVGHDDPGNFNYHLKRLRGNLVEKSEDGYRLSNIGHHFVAVLTSQRFDPEQSRAVPDPESACPLCERPVTAVYEDGMLQAECANGHGMRLNVGPELLDSRSPQDALDVGARRSLLDGKSTMDGICPYCEGETTGTANQVPEMSVPVVYEWLCSTCGSFFQNTPAGCVLFHPAVVAFCYERGIDVYQETWATLVGNVGSGTLCSEEPLRVDVAVTIDRARLVLTLDEEANVIDTSEQTA